MKGRKCDIAIAGGGLAGGLTALALHRLRPDLDIMLVETGETLGGNHRWSWFGTDLGAEGDALLAPFRKMAWPDGYDVFFPNRARHLSTPCFSLSSADFDAGLRQQLPPGAIRTRCQAAAIDAGGVTLADGERIGARGVIDCRGFAPSPHLSGGWQVFLGHHLRTKAPHGLDRPIIMDATVSQLGAYRFIYVLPLAPRELFIEDTCYADSPVLDRQALPARIAAYAAQHGWEGEIVGQEAGVLGVVTGGDFAAFQSAQRIPGVAIAGARGGFAHPLTSYTLPQAVETALFIARHADQPGERLADLLERRARDHWRATRFYRVLGAMLFGATPPERRWRIFERFHALPQGLIERFYAARSTRLDRGRILCGRPPVPLFGALGALMRRQPPLIERPAVSRRPIVSGKQTIPGRTAA